MVALEGGKKGHGDQRSEGDAHAKGARARLMVLEQRSERERGNEEGEDAEEKGGGAGGEALGHSQPGEKLKQNNGGGEELDEAIGGEGEQSGAVGEEGGAGRDAKLGKHPKEGNGLQPEDWNARRGGRVRPGSELDEFGHE